MVQVFVVTNVEYCTVVRLGFSNYYVKIVLNAKNKCSESDLEAEKSQKTLQSMVEQLLESHEDLSRRLRSIEDICESKSILTKCFRNGTSQDDDIESATIVPGDGVLHHYDTAFFGFERTTIQFTFENELESSRVYRRTKAYEQDVSFTSSAIRTHAWSIFTGMSLAEISIVSTIALPLFSHEISNSQWYHFGTSQNTEPSEPPLSLYPESSPTPTTTVPEITGGEVPFIVLPEAAVPLTLFNRSSNNAAARDSFSFGKISSPLGCSSIEGEPLIPLVDISRKMHKGDVGKLPTAVRRRPNSHYWEGGYDIHIGLTFD
jgi:hypothetical protein